MAGNAGAVPIAPTGSGPAAQRGENGFAFWCLMFFTFQQFIAPQAILPSLIPLHLGMTSAGLAIAAYALSRLATGEPLTVKAPEVWLALWLIYLAALSIPLSRWPGGSLDAFLDDLPRSMILFLLLANLVDTVRRMKLMIGSIILWGVFISLAAVRDFWAGHLGLDGVRISGYASPLVMNANDLALSLNLILALAMGFYLATSKPLSRLLLFGAMSLLTVGVIVSFSRGGFLTFAAILTVFLIKRVREEGFAAQTPLILLLLLSPVLLPPGYARRLHSIVDFASDPSGSASARWEGMRLAVSTILENPILGSGLGMHPIVSVDGGASWVSALTHNAFLQIGADLGVAGLVVYILFIWQVLKGQQQLQKQLSASSQARDIAAISSGVEIAVYGYIVGALFLPVSYNFYFFYVAGLGVAMRAVSAALARSTSPGELEIRGTHRSV